MSKKQLTKNVVFLGIVQVVNYLFPLITVPIISRVLGPEKFGIVSYAETFITYFTILIGYGFDFSATRRIAKDPTNTSLRNQVFSEVFSAQVMLFAISAMLFAACLFFVPPLAAEKEVAVFSFFICLATMLTQNWLFQAMQDLSKVAMMNFLGKFLSTVAIVFVIRTRSDYVWQPLILSSSAIVVSVISFIWAWKRYHLRFPFVPFSQVLRLLWSEKVVFASMIVTSLYITTNTVMLGWLTNETEVGYYSAATRLANMAVAITNIPLAQALFPFIGKAFGESKAKGIETVQRITPIVLLLTGATTVLMLLFGTIALHLLYGSAFNSSIEAFRILAFIPFMNALHNLFGIQVMLNLKKDKFYFLILSVGAVFGLLLNYVMIHFMGFVGTAWNYLIMEMYIVLATYLALRRAGINPFDKEQFSPRTIKEHVWVLYDLFTKKI